MNEQIISDPKIAAALKVLHDNFIESGSAVREWWELFTPKSHRGEQDEYELTIRIRVKR